MIIEQSCMILRLVRTIYDFITNALPCPRRPVCNVLLTQGLLFVCVVPYHIEVFSSCTLLCSNLFISDIFSGIKREHWEENGQIKQLYHKYYKQRRQNVVKNSINDGGNTQKKMINLSNDLAVKGRRMLTFYFLKILCSIQKQPPEMLCKKRVLKNFPNFTGKHVCWSLFLIKLQALGPATLLKRGSNTGAFL